ncbi:hypothetical protein [Paenibacillus periandrae]|uniref:hypothetical protein n=1 Tax=Paenibacillus periandrae TaxID=1761741 RepID=UPI001F09F9AB|nr:hypothetical protein [Paenibacillus periandrae]
MKVDLLEQEYHPFLIIGKGNEILAEVYVVHLKHIQYTRSTRKGKIRIKRAV